MLPYWGEKTCKQSTTFSFDKFSVPEDTLLLSILEVILDMKCLRMLWWDVTQETMYHKERNKKHSYTSDSAYKI